MIIPNLLVADIGRSVAFYRSKLDFKLEFTVSKDRDIDMQGGVVENACFATLLFGEARLMLQTADSLSEEFSFIAADQKPVASGTVYVEHPDPDSMVDRFAPEEILSGPLTQWYGMRELNLRDPDGYIITLGVTDPNAAPPA
ncbi:MAG: VOC family protein [Magnetovibrionaceae bacterium]